MPLPADFKESNHFIVLTGMNDMGEDVGCPCGGWFHAYRDQPTDRPKGQVWCRCDTCGKDEFQPATRTGCLWTLSTRLGTASIIAFGVIK